MSLSKYNTKRNFNETAEPAGKKPAGKSKELIFVIQRHKASRLHYDFRLEMEGVLKSWAVPKGPSLNPHHKRLAMMVEDHPYDYKDFAGVIPDGNYGAGIVEVWDHGTYTSLEAKDDTAADEKLLRAGLKAGNLKFTLHGKKLKGEFALVKLKDAESNSWLLIKHRDSYAVDDDYNSEDNTPANSPINKWLTENKSAGNIKKPAAKTAVKKTRATEGKTTTAETAAVKKKALTAELILRKLPDYIPAMLAKETAAPFSDKDWIYEIKWDGYRAIAEANDGDIKLYSRNGNSFLQAYPLVVKALASLSINAVLDGEIVVLNEDGNPDFQKLQHYSEFKNYPIVYYVFDLLAMDGHELYNEPLIKRKELLKELLPDSDIIKYSDHIEENGEEFFAAASKKNLEGIMAKRSASLYYRGRRTSDWLKVKTHKTDEAIIAGFTEPRGGRKFFGALVLGAMVSGKLTYIGHTGSGFDSKTIKEVYSKLKPIIRDTSPFSKKIKTNMPVTWVEPEYVCELKFSEWTSDKKMRHPIFLRMREDKLVADVCINPGKTVPMKKVVTTHKKAADKTAKAKSEPAKVIPGKPVKTAVSKAVKTTATEASDDIVTNENEKIYRLGNAIVKTTNRKKIFFPDDKITKGGVIDYYESMADIILPYIKDRPQSLFRTPNGIKEHGFFQKDAGHEAPAWVKHVPLYSDSVKKNIEYILCNDKATLLYLANLGCIEINPWHSTIKSLDKPGYLIIDIDPGDNNTFDHVIEAANVVKEILDKAGAMCICKTSGSSGLHIYVPLGQKYDYDQAKDFANLVCLMATQILPGTTTLERNLAKRGKDKIYMDYLQNRRGQTIACAYSLRPKAGATVSTPLAWHEVKKGLHPKDFDIKNIHARLAKTGDLFAPVLDKKNAIDIKKCLKNLEATQ